MASVFICAPEESQQHLRSITLNDCDLAHFYPVSLPQLHVLELANNSLVSSQLDTSPFELGNYPNLTELNVSGNVGISELDVTDCPELMKLHANGCNLSSVDLSQCPELHTLALSDNHIAAIDLGNNKQLAYLYLGNNPIKNLDFEKLLRLEVVDISGTPISRAELFYCYYLKEFRASNSLLEFVDFNAQQPERMNLIDLRDCPGFTPLSMAYTLKTLPVARTTMSTATSLYVSGSHPEIADIAYLTSPEMGWVCDSQGDASANYPVIPATISNATLTDEIKQGSIDRLYPYGGLGLDYLLEVHQTEGGKFLLAQWEPEFFQTITSVSQNLRRGVPVCVYAYPDEGKQFKSVTVNGREVFSKWFMVDADQAEIKVNFEDKESVVSFNAEPGQLLSFSVATSSSNGTVEIDWGTGSRVPYTGISPYRSGDIEANGTRIEGKAAGNTINIYGDVAAVDISCYGEIGEELFGMPNNRITAIDPTGCPGLKMLNLYWNPITSLDLSKNSELEMLDASYTAIGVLDVSACPKLIYLEAYANSDELGDDFAQISTIDISNNPKLRFIDLHNQNLSSIDVAGCADLTTLNITNNSLGALDVTHNAKLYVLRASNNKIASLDLNANARLVELYVDGNELQNLNLSNNTLLEELSVANNNITALDTHALTELGRLSVNGNGMSAEQLNDLFYLLPERKHRDSDDDAMTVKSNLIINQANDRTANDGNGADGSLAVARLWTPNPNGTNSTSTTSYIDINQALHGTFVLTDSNGRVISSGNTVMKYDRLTVNAAPEENYIYKGVSLNGEEPIEGQSFLMPGVYTVVTPVFEPANSLEALEADATTAIYVNIAGNIVVESTGAVAAVYTPDGKLVAEAALCNGRAEIVTPVSGTLIVNVTGNGVAKAKTIYK